MIKIKKTVFYAHTIGISAFFIMGQFVITLPFIKSFYSLSGFVLSAVAGVLLCLVLLPLSKKILSCKHSFFKGIILSSVSVFALFILSDTFKTFCGFVADVLLDSSRDFAVVLFSAVCLYFAFRRQEDVLKFSLLGVIYTLVVILGFTLLMLPNFKVQNITLPESFNVLQLADGFKTEFLNIFLPTVLLCFYQYAINGSMRKSAVFVGIITGAVILAVCGLSAILLFGSEFSSVLNYPYLSAVSCVSVGKLFSRLDAVLYFCFFFSCLLRIQVCIFTVKFCLQNIGKPQKI